MKVAFVWIKENLISVVCHPHGIQNDQTHTSHPLNTVLLFYPPHPPRKRTQQATLPGIKPCLKAYKISIAKYKYFL